MIPVRFLGLSLVFKSKPLRVRHPSQLLITACAALVFAKGLAPDAFAAETVKAFRAGAEGFNGFGSKRVRSQAFCEDQRSASSNQQLARMSHAERLAFEH